MSLIAFPDSVNNVTKTAKKTATDLTVRFADMIVAAAGIVAALSWNDAIKSLFADGGVFYKFAKGGVWVTAALVTLFAVALGFWRTKLIPPTPKK
ncbi:hypothetical protein PBCV1_A201L [Paramecium bursaria Chlorella virus 1]|uniref:Uncharacterized protein n=1 Tax=Paramecium bursaria Chlorella virus 1 TaxID=10506 RepID=Q84521_PBCV1|nr:hypothetical protein PBCV1_A201L [Paramecium bursaria Chlorella virus 1]AAC96569.1 hypothetical protein [Paramecium bursaria Chlorella virus 1]